MMINNTPYYVFEEKDFIENYKNLENAMKRIYSNYKVSYSYKTNYTPYICQLVKKLGGYAEVVSDMEYKLAKKIGYSNYEIVYNGPAKGECLEEHVLNDGILNIDNYQEAHRVVTISKKCSKQLRVGLRINLNLNDKFISRFGLEGEELDETVKLLKSNNIKIVGLHCHISRNRDIDSWEQRANIMVAMADKYIDGVPEYISLGSGMFADMDIDLKKQFSNVPTYDEYAKRTLSVFAKHYQGKEQPVVFTEPGTTVVARYLSFYTKVLNIRSIRGRNIATTDGCYEQLGEICQLKKLPVRINSDGKHYDKIDIMGYTCLEQDLMYESYQGKINIGDIIKFENVGGYSIVFKPQFIKPNCPMYVKKENDNYLEIMRAETFDDVFDKFKF